LVLKAWSTSGDPTKRGVITTSSYEARAFGVQSGLPLRTTARRCPDAVFLAADRAASYFPLKN
jgi:DNA polymerase IV